VGIIDGISKGASWRSTNRNKGSFVVRLVVYCEQWQSPEVSLAWKNAHARTFVIAPLSATPLDVAVISTLEHHQSGSERSWRLFPVRKFRYHINLDDIDLTKDHLMGTIARVVGRHGLGIWLLVSI
jgi:hypothetical protein